MTKYYSIPTREDPSWAIGGVTQQAVEEKRGIHPRNWEDLLDAVRRQLSHEQAVIVIGLLYEYSTRYL